MHFFAKKNHILDTHSVSGALTTFHALREDKNEGLLESLASIGCAYMFKIPMAVSDVPFAKIDAVCEKIGIFVDSAKFSVDSAADSDSAFAQRCNSVYMHVLSSLVQIEL